MRFPIWILGIALGVLTACDELPVVLPEQAQSPIPNAATSQQPVVINDLNRRALAAVNDFRTQARRGPLRYSSTLGRVARLHAADMNRRGVMSHTGANGSTPANRATAAGYRWCKIAENVAAGQPDLQTVMTSWANSPGHRRNMLDLNLTEIGVAQVGPYWAMVLGKPGC